ncbi:hypothetical protein EII29_09790 [Leptotrichia sp. OH3620_COT-345]|uniref:phage terminase large subunit n=1 Tax=Leptotrichia sp. OH3620_COT-345 TaxID=2491048 RepID=UPI000F648051|nr:phage terminase large subunit [Leptotrichia sp. OH3620_COT-345]RRD38807.1 hypothetical protein EII29_09790 [Leptotrichia sp. OH3620_COT-345]
MEIKSKIQAEVLKRKIYKEKARRSLLEFLIYDGEGRYKRAKHIEFLTKKVQEFIEKVESGQSPRMYICMPPRHSKSETTTKKMPAWVVGNKPDWEIIIAAYNADLAGDFGKIARDTYKKHNKTGTGVFKTELDKDKSAGSDWGINLHRGSVVSTGVGGSATGKGAHIAIIDDPFKNREDANSKIQREKVWSWYQSTIRTRLAPGGGIIIIQTRWHDDDLVGKIIKEMKDGTGELFEGIVLPAIAEENDILGREPGEPLWPERYSLKELESIRKAIGEREFISLYQQRPQAEDGGLFKRQFFKYFKVVEKRYIEINTEIGIKRIDTKECFCFQTIDTALTVKKNSDSTAIATWVVDKEYNLYLIDLFLAKIEVPDQWATIKQYRTKYDGFLKFQAIETKSSGIGIKQQAEREGISLKELIADVDKTTRALAISVMFESGKVYFYKDLPNLLELEEQLLKFPNAAHDDAVDVCSYAGIVINELNKMFLRYERRFIGV